jgi:hypothetical protein
VRLAQVKRAAAGSVVGTALTLGLALGLVEAPTDARAMVTPGVAGAKDREVAEDAPGEDVAVLPPEQPTSPAPKRARTMIDRIGRDGFSRAS